MAFNGGAMNSRPLVWVAVWWVFGSAAAAGLSSSGALLAAGAGVLLALAAALCRQAAWPLAAICAAAVCVAAGQRLWADARNVTALPALMAEAQAAGPQVAYAVEATGRIVSAVDVDGDRVRFRLEAASIRLGQDAAPRQLRERVQVTVRLAEQPDQAVAAALKRGDAVAIAGELSLPAGPSNSGGFDYRRYLGSQRIHWLLTAKGIGAVTKTAPGPILSTAALLGRVDDARSWLGARMDALYPDHQAGYMKGLVLGIREDLEPEQFQQFSRLGLTHILAISGLHVAVFLYALGMLLRLARFSRERAMLVLMISIPFYVLLSGASPSVMRAGIMSLLGLLAARFGKLKDGLHLLSAAAVMMLAWDPLLIENISFQLSYIVTIGLIIGTGPIRRLLPMPKRGAALIDAAVVAVVAGCVSFPLSIYYFNQFHLLSIPVNFVLVPFISFIVLPLGAVSLLVSVVWPAGGMLIASAAHYANDLSFIVVEWLDGIKPLRTIWASPPMWWVAVVLLLLVVLFNLLQRRHALVCIMESARMAEEQLTAPLLRTESACEAASSSASNWQSASLDQYAAVASSDIYEAEQLALGDKLTRAKRHLHLLLAVLLSCQALLLGYAYEPDRWRTAAAVNVLNVGQGDAILIRTPGGKHMLVDGGGAISYQRPGEEWRIRRDPYEVGRKVVVPLLMKRGVRELDVLVISHLDTDHILGLQAVIDAIPVKEIWWNGTWKESEETRTLFSQAIAAQIPVYAVHAGMDIQLEKHAEVSVLWPMASHDVELPIIANQNNSSVVLELKLYGMSFVLSGDIDAATERAIIANQSKQDSVQRHSGAEVLKLAHHGSRFSTSEEWLNYWSPAGAAVSVSATNSYGHPHPDVLGRIHRASALLWRTDLDGEIRFLITARGINVYN